MKNLNKFIGVIICLVVLITSLFISSPDALAEFSRGTVRNGRFDSTTAVLDRTFKKPGGYIRKRELSFLTPLKRVNVYDNSGKKIGVAKKNLRSSGLDVYNEKGKRVGYYSYY